GQGKWYPGEPLPRWALTLFWRRDGEPVWRDRALLAHPQDEDGYGHREARRLMEAITAELGLPAQRIVRAFEHTAYYLWRESTLPRGVTPTNRKLKDPLERKRLARLFNRGLNEPAGYALPLKFVSSGGGYWQTGPWPFRSGKLLLVPGDSPMGLRLPLDTLPWQSEPDLEPGHDPFADLAPLRKGKLSRAAAARASRDIIHTALCVEAREGRLHLFMPPLARLEDYLALLEVLEAAAASTGLKLMLEGYEPPFDRRLTKLQITPDPGVIEVNVQPASSWRELVDNTTMLYEQARQTRLGTEKFMLDGRHTGTGGGNHVTLGATQATDSPFLRRPHLLRSLITFWQQHPALSYLFSGNFIGPTSQAPRVDEARDDNLYELEIAFEQLPDGDSDQPWRVDRVLRNFLVDLTGNTHRSEFCIDKLYSPDSASGRRGLLELRNFEMPPHPQMSLLQMLLVRALVAHFWSQPYGGRLTRWGTALHDRFMLRHYVWEDLAEIVEFLRGAGYPFELSWFDAFREFRFPRIGTVQVGPMTLTLHTALEPWHVLGEESGAQGTSRYVDSSVERLQVSISGMVEDRHAVTCNGRRIPLRPTGVPGEFVGGVRYKAWDPYSALHPTIEVHTPLTFDILDLANRRSLGGCEYHVAHPGGRNYDTFPVNASEAEARRHARFTGHGHTQGNVPVPPAEVHSDQAYSLDLRRAPPLG
ncbi:MAG: transglutaminase family protein, partial [Pseudomonadota bacterium]